MNIASVVRRLADSRFIRFGAVGGAGFVVNEAALVLAHGLFQAGPNLSWLLAFIPSVTFTWWGNRVLTFADKASDGHAGMAAEWARFVATNSFGAAANFAVYWVLTHLAPRPFAIPYVALAVGVLVGLLFNFTLSKKLVFRA
jgi:putative flippase GtrA